MNGSDLGTKLSRHESLLSCPSWKLQPAVLEQHELNQL